jgi:hypothetical protein
VAGCAHLDVCPKWPRNRICTTRHTGRVHLQSPDTRVLTTMIFVDLRRWCTRPFNRKELS